MPFIISFFILVFSFSGFAQEETPSFEIQTRLTLRSQNQGLLMERVQDYGHLREVNQAQTLELKFKARFTLLDDGTIHVDLGKGIDVRTYRNGEVSVVTLREFILRGPERKVDQFMDYRPGAIVIDSEVTTNDLVQAYKFSTDMAESPDGITFDMARVRENGLPIQLYQVRSLSLNLDAESVLTHGMTDLLLTSYWLDDYVNKSLIDGFDGPYHKRLEHLSEAFAVDEEFVVDYKRAADELISRYTLLESRGWREGVHSNLENRETLESGAEVDSTNLVPFGPVSYCSKIL